jgi:hypothetical protein
VCIIEDRATTVGATFVQLPVEIPHYVHIRNVLNAGDTQPVFILDPDIVLWDNLENYDTDKLIAGRMIPEFTDSYTSTRTKMRLHTSCLYIQSTQALNHAITAVESTYFEADLLRPVMVKSGDTWLRWDTIAQLCAALPNDYEVFTPEVNDKFDHIFCGSHVQHILNKWDIPRLRETHILAQTNPVGIKGIWREQEQLFLEYSPCELLR